MSDENDIGLTTGHLSDPPMATTSHVNVPKVRPSRYGTAVNIIGDTDIEVHRHGTTFQLALRKQPKIEHKTIARGASATKKDFALYVRVVSGVQQVGVKFGNVTPGGVVVLGSDVDPWPDNFSASSTPPYIYSFAPSGDGIVWLHVTIDADSIADESLTVPVISNITVDHGTSFPTYDSTNGYIMLGNYTVSGGVITIANGDGIGSQVYGYCGGYSYFDLA